MSYNNSGYRRYANSEGYSDPTAALAFPEEFEVSVKPEQPLKFVHDTEYGEKLDWNSIVKIWL